MIKLISGGLLIGCFLLGYSPPSYGEMTGTSFKLSNPTMDDGGQSGTSTNFVSLNASGQSSTIGEAVGQNFVLQSGFIYGNEFSAPPDVVIPGVITPILDIINTGNLPNNQVNSLNKAVNDLNKALNSYNLYVAGDPNMLTTFLLDLRKAIDKIVKSGVTGLDDSVVMLLQSAELAVTVEANAKAAIVGDTDNNIVKARADLAIGASELLLANYMNSINAFDNAYKEVLKA